MLRTYICIYECKNTDIDMGRDTATSLESGMEGANVPVDEDPCWIALPKALYINSIQTVGFVH